MKRDDFIRLTLSEAPIGDINMLGNWEKNSSFRARDRKALTNPKLIQKTRAYFNHTPYDFQMFFVNHPEGKKGPNEPGRSRGHSNAFHGLIGGTEEAMEYVEKNLPRLAPEFRQMQEYGQGFKDDSINIIYGNNTSGDNVPMTPWMIAHRIAHALERTRGTNFQNDSYEYIHEIMIRSANAILKSGYQVPDQLLMSTRSRLSMSTESYYKNQTYRYFFRAVGKTRAMREGNLSFYSEAMPEMLAQYICTGSISFNPLPNSMKMVYGYPKYHRSDYSDIRPEGTRWFRLQNPELATKFLDDMTESLNDAYDGLLMSAVGSVFMV